MIINRVNTTEHISHGLSDAELASNLFQLCCSLNKTLKVISFLARYRMYVFAYDLYTYTHTHTLHASQYLHYNFKTTFILAFINAYLGHLIPILYSNTSICATFSPRLNLQPIFLFSTHFSYSRCYTLNLKWIHLQCIHCLT